MASFFHTWNPYDILFTPFMLAMRPHSEKSIKYLCRPGGIYDKEINSLLEFPESFSLLPLLKSATPIHRKYSTSISYTYYIPSDYIPSDYIPSDSGPSQICVYIFDTGAVSIYYGGITEVIPRYLFKHITPEGVSMYYKRYYHDLTYESKRIYPDGKEVIFRRPCISDEK